MNKLSPKTISLIMFIALLALAVALSGCSSNSTGNGGNSGNGGAAPTAGEGSSDSGSGSTPAEKKDITVSIYDRGNFPPAEGTLEDNRWTTWINENGPANVSFVPIPRSEARDKLNLLFASSSAPDLIFEFDMGFKNSLFSQNLLMPLDELIETHSTAYKQLLADNPKLDSLGRKSDGKLYEVGRLKNATHVSSLLIRKDWLDRLQLDVPETIDDLYNVIKAFAENDPDGNSQRDTYGIAMSAKTGQIIEHMFQNVQPNPGFVVRDGELVFDWEPGKASLEFRKRLFDEGLVDKDFLTDSVGEKARQDFVNGRLGIFGSGNHGDTFNTVSALLGNNPDAEVIPIMLPETPFGRFSPSMDAPIQMTAVVNRGAKNPEAIIQYIDFLASEDTQVTMSRGFEGEHYTMVDGCPQPIDMQKNTAEINPYSDYHMLFSAQLLFEGKCTKTGSQYDENDPIGKKVIDILRTADELYVSPDRPIAQFTHPEWFPSIPKDIELIITGTRNMYDAWNRAIVGGDSYSVEQAIADSQKIWYDAGGQQAEDFYKQWYQDNKDSWLFTKDIYN